MLLPTTKGPLQSLTITSAAGSFLVTLLSIFGIDLSVEVAQAIVVNVNAIVAAGLALVSIYGRIKATKTVKLSP